MLYVLFLIFNKGIFDVEFDDFDLVGIELKG